MNERLFKAKPHWQSSYLFAVISGLLAVALVSYITFVISFLSITKRVDADVLVVEAWIPPYQFRSAAEEFRRGHYSRLIVSGQQKNSPEDQDSFIVVKEISLHLEELGVPRNALIACVAPYAQWRRTANMARAVRERIHKLGFKPQGINVLTEGTHARETWAAFRHMFGGEIPVGIIAIPKVNFPAPRWWATGQAPWVAKDFLGWLKEIVFPIRS